jgi:hypothetical protein
MVENSAVPSQIGPRSITPRSQPASPTSSQLSKMWNGEPVAQVAVHSFQEMAWVGHRRRLKPAQDQRNGELLGTTEVVP